jgi:2-keto-4-pentenoate hydratase/2-oxohepta-3-ene-1,7-dioic acid hydratase in catechol pathway
MKLCRFSRNGVHSIGRLEGEKIRVCKGDLLGRMEATKETVPVGEVKLLAPTTPTKIIGIGRNYAEHAKEMGSVAQDAEPLIFLKPPSSVISPGESIVLPLSSQRVDHEGELGVVIGQIARSIPETADPLGYVLGYTCVNDVTARDLQKRDVQFTRGKGFDTFCPFGPWIETELDPGGLKIETRVNGQTRQKGNTVDMIFPVHKLIRFLASIMTLYPGDLIATGTPAGVGPLAPGDVVEVEVERIGILSNPVV